jgi:zeaxanthin glucosyltransferase
VFRTIAEGCAPFDVQLVLSLGGGRLLPKHFESLPGNPVVVHYAPQRELLKRAVLTINCAGLNTTLDSILEAVPLVAIPIAEDQPGVAARIEQAAVGRVIPVRALGLHKLRQAIRDVMENASYRSAATHYQAELRRVDGTRLAAAIVVRALAA